MLADYQWDDQNNTDNDLTTIIIKPTIYSGTPGQTNLEGDYPNLKQLKRIKVANNDGVLHVVSWYLSNYPKDTLIHGGITPQMFTHEFGSSMKSIAVSNSSANIIFQKQFALVLGFADDDFRIFLFVKKFFGIKSLISFQLLNSLK